MELETASVYVDMDSLFDTRIATLQKFGIDVVAKNLSSGYYGRVSDEFEGIDQAQYLEAYNNRDKRTLFEAMVTPVSEILKNFAKRTLVALVASPYRRQPKVVVNLYPYRLTESEIKNLIAALAVVTDSLLDIEVTYKSMDELTPSYMKSTFVQVVMYHYKDWLEYHAKNENLIKTQCPNLIMVGPMLLASKEAARKVEGFDIFEAMESYSSVFVKLVLHPVNQFCVDLLRFKEKHKLT